MKSHIVGATTSQPSNSAVNYNSVTSGGTGSWNATEAVRAQVVPHAMTLDQLRVVISASPGTSKSYDYTVMVNGVASALTLNISGAAVSAQDLTHTVSLNAGDVISLASTPNSTPNVSGVVYWTIRQDATSLFGVLGQNVGSPNSGTNYQPIQNRALTSSSNVLGNQIMPTSGVLKNLYVNFRSAPTAGQGLQVTLMLNGVASALTATVSDTATQASDTTHTVTVAAGDLVALQLVANGTPTSTTVSFAMSFDPDTDGESFLLNNGNGVGPSTSATQFENIVGPDATWNATESNRYTRLAATTLKALYVETSVSPGISPKAYALTVRQEIADTAATVTVNDASTSVGSTRRGQITGQTITIADDDRLAIKSVPTSSPGSVFVKTSLLLFISAGTTTQQTIQGLARIAITSSQTVQGKARVTASASQTVQGKSRITATTPQTIPGKSRITATTQQTATGRARITNTSSQTAQGKSRIQITTSRTIQGLARVTAATARTVQGLARITASTARTILGKGAVLKSASQTVQGHSRIQITTSQTILGKSRVTATTSRTVQGLARITAIVQRTILGRARLTATSSQTVQGKGAILKTTSRTILGLAQMTGATTQNVLGRGRVTNTATRTVQGVARILRIVSATITGKSRITKSASQTIQGKSRVQITSSQTLLGRTRVMRIVGADIAGRARLEDTVLQTIPGKSRIVNSAGTTQQTITGVAHICVDEWQTPDTPAWQQAQNNSWYSNNSTDWFLNC